MHWKYIRNLNPQGPRCKERGMLYVQAVSLPPVEKGLLFPRQTGHIFGLELIPVLHPKDPQFLLRDFWRPPVLAKSVNFWALPESVPTRLHARLHARHRRSPRDTPDEKPFPTAKKTYIFSLVFELYINFSELYIKWSGTIYKFLRTIYKISGKFPGKFRDIWGGRTGSWGKACERPKPALNSTWFFPFSGKNSS